jgi:undecaprenyl-diphosphatase
MTRVRVTLMAGALCAALAAYLSVRFLTNYFETKTLTPFAIYCVVAGIFYLILT